MTFVLLTDGDDATALVACPDLATARRVGSAAIFATGGVSAWLVPTRALEVTEDLLEVLRRGGSLADLEPLEEQHGSVDVVMEAVAP